MAKGAIQGGATDVWGGSCPKLPPLDPPLLAKAFGIGQLSSSFFTYVSVVK